MTPPPAWPYSALKPLVSTVNSVMASTDGAFDDTQLFDRARGGVGGNAVERGAVAGSLAAAEDEAVIAAEVLGIRASAPRDRTGCAPRRRRRAADRPPACFDGDAGLGVFRLQLHGGGLHLNRLRGRAYLAGLRRRARWKPRRVSDSFLQRDGILPFRCGCCTCPAEDLEW